METLRVRTSHRSELVEITAQVRAVVERAGLGEGMVALQLFAAAPGGPGAG